MPGLHTRWAFHGSSAVAALLHALSPMKEQALSVLSKNWLILVQLRNPLSPIQSLAARMNCHFVSHCQKYNQQQTCDIQDSQNRGFQPLMSGTRGNALWGSGTYFARDAKLPGWKSLHKMWRFAKFKGGHGCFLLGMSMTVAFVALAWMEVDKSCCSARMRWGWVSFLSICQYSLAL